MPWKETKVMDERIAFVVRAGGGSESMSKLCDEFGISRPTGYLWCKRYEESGSVVDLKELSRRPRPSPHKTSPEIEGRVVQLRQRDGWGAKKIFKLLCDEGVSLPIITINRIIKRHGLVKREDSHRLALKRFERKHPNELWQMDFKGEFSVKEGYCYPLTLLDDHSRFALGVFALPDQHTESVWRSLVRVFESYGVPQTMLMDHGKPWWSTTNGHGLTRLAINLIRQGVKLYWSGIGHPQTQGKIERFHRTLKHDILHRGRPGTVAEWQSAFENFIQNYNNIRPHEALEMDTPVKRYIPSQVAFSPEPPEWEYAEGAIVKRLNSQGMIEHSGRRYFVCEALARECVQVQYLNKKLLIKYRHMYIREIEPKTGRTKAIVTPESKTDV